jgi:hypothetical protein
VGTVRDWVDQDIERAHVVAARTGPVAAGLSSTARFLITEFGTDESVTQLLRSGLLPLAYAGADTAMYRRILNQLTDTDDSRRDPVTEWLQDTVEWLRDLLVAARQAAES